MNCEYNTKKIEKTETEIKFLIIFIIRIYHGILSISEITTELSIWRYINH